MDTEAEAITVWNTRPQEDRLEKRLEKLWDRTKDKSAHIECDNICTNNCFDCHLYSGLDK